MWHLHATIRARAVRLLFPEVTDIIGESSFGKSEHAQRACSSRMLLETLNCDCACSLPTYYVGKGRFSAPFLLRRFFARVAGMRRRDVDGPTRPHGARMIPGTPENKAVAQPGVAALLAGLRTRRSEVVEAMAVG